MSRRDKWRKRRDRVDDRIKMVKERAFEDDEDPPSWYRQKGSEEARAKAAASLLKAYAVAFLDGKEGAAEAFAYQLRDLDRDIPTEEQCKKLLSGETQ